MNAQWKTEDVVQQDVLQKDVVQEMFSAYLVHMAKESYLKFWFVIVVLTCLVSAEQSPSRLLNANFVE